MSSASCDAGVCIFIYLSSLDDVLYVMKVAAANADRRDVERMYNRRTIRQLQHLAPFVSIRYTP